eukprot:jgi/Mesvir1/6896/Mv09057-RA.1
MVPRKLHNYTASGCECCADEEDGQGRRGRRSIPAHGREEASQTAWQLASDKSSSSNRRAKRLVPGRRSEDPRKEAQRLMGSLMSLPPDRDVAEMMSMATGGRHDMRMYTVLVRELAAQGEWSTAIDVLDWLQLSGLHLDTQLYNAGIAACARGGPAGQPMALRLFQSMLSCGHATPDTITYNTLMKVYRDAGNLGGVLAAFKGLTSAHCVPTVVTYTTLIDAQATLGSYAAALDSFRAMQEAGIPPNTWTYNTLIAAAGRAKEWHDALELFSDMRAAGVVPDAVTLATVTGHFNQLLQSASKRGLVKWALQLLEKMRALALPPCQLSYDLALAACCHRGAWVAALDVFADLRAQRALSPTTFSYNMVLSALEKAGEWRLALRTAGLPCTHDAVAWTAEDDARVAALPVMYGPAAALRSQFAAAALAPGGDTLPGATGMGAAGGVPLVRHPAAGAMSRLPPPMLTRGSRCIPDAFTFTTLVACCGAGGLLDCARHIVEVDMPRAGLTPGTPTYNALLGAMFRAAQEPATPATSRAAKSASGSSSLVSPRPSSSSSSSSSPGSLSSLSSRPGAHAQGSEPHAEVNGADLTHADGSIGVGEGSISARKTSRSRSAMSSPTPQALRKGMHAGDDSDAGARHSSAASSSSKQAGTAANASGRGTKSSASAAAVAALPASELVSLLSRMAERGIARDATSYDLAIRACVVQGACVEAWALHTEMTAGAGNGGSPRLKPKASTMEALRAWRAYDAETEALKERLASDAVAPAMPRELLEKKEEAAARGGKGRGRPKGSRNKAPSKRSDVFVASTAVAAAHQEVTVPAAGSPSSVGVITPLPPPAATPAVGLPHEVSGHKTGPPAAIIVGGSSDAATGASSNVVTTRAAMPTTGATVAHANGAHTARGVVASSQVAMHGNYSVDGGEMLYGRPWRRPLAASAAANGEQLVWVMTPNGVQVHSRGSS